MQKARLKQVDGNSTTAKSYCQNIVICKVKPFHTRAAVAKLRDSLLICY